MIMPSASDSAFKDSEGARNLAMGSTESEVGNRLRLRLALPPGHLTYLSSVGSFITEDCDLGHAKISV